MINSGTSTTARRVFGKRSMPPKTSRQQLQRMQIVRDAAANTNVAPDKFEQLLAMEERVAERESRAAFDRDYAQLQCELPAIAERGVLYWPDGREKSTYALWEDINETIKPYLSKHGFALWFSVAQEIDKVLVTCRLCHVQGHSTETTLRLPVDLTDGKNAVQAIGSSTSYGKRYAASALLNITTIGDDDDGAVAGRQRTIDAEQVIEIRRLLNDVGAEESKFLAHCGAASIETIPASRYRAAQSMLHAKGARK